MSNLRRARIAQGLSQKELAEKSRTPQPLICAVELGHLKVWPALAYRTAGVLGMPVSELFPSISFESRFAIGSQVRARDNGGK